MPEDQILTATSDTADLDRLSNIVSTAQNQIAAQAIDFLDQSIPTTIPAVTRQQIILSASQQIAHQAIKELSQYPHLDPEEYAAVQQHAMAEAVHLAQQTSNSFFNLTTHKQRQQLSQHLEDSLNSDQAQQAAQAAYQQKQLPPDPSLPQSPQELAQAILDKPGDNFGVTPDDLAKVVQDVQTQTLNQPTSEQIDSATGHVVRATFSAPVAEQFGKKLKQKENQALVTKFIQTSTRSLPRKTPFTPFSPTISSKTLRQARYLKVNPLALAYVKSGFPSNHPQIPQYLQAQIAQTYALIDNPQSASGFWGKITASSLQPQTFLAQKHYFPIYQAHQQALSKANKFLEKPYNFYQTVSNKYQDFQKSYQELK